jgi:hypothetical protein
MGDAPTLDELIKTCDESGRLWDRDVGVHLRRLRALDAAVQRVRELHAPVPRAHQDGGGRECTACYDSDGVAVASPCSTIAALDAGGGA